MANNSGYESNSSNPFNIPNINGGYGVVPNAPNTYTWPQVAPSYPLPSSIWNVPEVEDAQEREGAIEYIEALMFLIQEALDDCDVNNLGGTMDRNPDLPLEAILDLGNYEIVIKKKR